MRRLACVALVIAACTLGSCSLAPSLFILNNTGRAIEIVLASNDGDRRTSELNRGLLPLPYFIRNGSGRNVIWSGDNTLDVLIRVGDCRAWYVFPRLTNTSYNAHLVAQIEPDRRAFVVDENGLFSGKFTVTSKLPPQTRPFPLRPMDVLGCESTPAGIQEPAQPM